MADAKLVAALRARTGAGMMACKKALDEAGDDMEKAVENLRKAGELKAAKKSAERSTSDGVIATYVHHNRKLAAMVEVQCESDFVALNSDFIAFAEEIAMQIAAMNPLYISPEHIPESDLARQKEIFLQEMTGEQKPDDIKAKIVQGKLDKWMAEVCLTKQDYFKDEERTIESLLVEEISTIGEKIVISKFTRWELGIEPKKCD